MNWEMFWAIFHREWGYAANTNTYNKENWKEMQRMLLQLQEQSMTPSLEQPSPLQNVPSAVSDGTGTNSYEGSLLPPFITVSGIHYNVRQVRQRLEYLQTIISVAHDDGCCSMTWKSLMRELPDVEQVEIEAFSREKEAVHE